MDSYHISRIEYCKDWRFWFLLLVVNMSGNLFFTYILPYKLMVSLVFVGIAYYCIFKTGLSNYVYMLLLLWAIILLGQFFYTSEGYSFSSNIHAWMKISVGIMTVILLGNKIVAYYNRIIYLISIVSLVCFAYNVMGGIIPYIPIRDAALDGGQAMRVTSVFYTQLYNLEAGGGFLLRNCGLFWEPGAFQGFVNLAIFFEIVTVANYTRGWYVKMAVLVVTVLTTISTGGFIVLALNILFFLYKTKQLGFDAKILIVSFLLLVFVYLFFSLDFLFSKISSDSHRLGVGADDFSFCIETMFGFGFGAESIANSAIKSASSLFNLIRYVGLVGFVLYFFPALNARFYSEQLVFLVILALLLMNEPFITNGTFWWGVPWIWKYIATNHSNGLETTSIE